MRCLGLLLTLLQTQWSIVSAQKWNLKPISQRWGGLKMMSSLQESRSATHLHGQGTVTKSCSLTVNPPRQVGLLQG